MFVVTSSLRLSHIVLISVVSPHLRSDRTYRYSPHRTGTGADQIKGYFSRRGRKYVEMDNQTLSRSFSSLFPQNLLTRSTWIPFLFLPVVVPMTRSTSWPPTSLKLRTMFSQKMSASGTTAIMRDWNPTRSRPYNPLGLSGKMGWSSSPCNCQSPRSKCRSCPNGESAEEMTSRVDCVIRQVRSPLPPHGVLEVLLTLVLNRFVNIIGSGKRRVKEPETSWLSLMATLIVASSRVGSSCLFPKVRVSYETHWEAFVRWARFHRCQARGRTSWGRWPSNSLWGE